MPKSSPEQSDVLQNGSGVDHRQLGPSQSQLLGQHAETEPPHGFADPTTSVRGDLQDLTDELPDLDGEVYVLDTDEGTPRDRRAATMVGLQALALDTALTDCGDVVWIDTQGYVSTLSLTRVAPSPRALDRVHLARAFTIHQHRTLIEQTAQWLRGGADSPFGSPDTDEPAAIVVPAVDVLYQAGELSDEQSRELFTRTVAVLRHIAREHGLPVLTTRGSTDAFTDPLTRDAVSIDVHQTQFRPRFECDALGFETVAYPCTDGTIQTTLSFWREILRSRHNIAAEQSTTPRQISTVTPRW